eukprot:4816307-Prorocentrum_lima.AAC.1
MVPPNSKYSVKERTKAAESDEESQSSTQTSTAASSANVNATQGNNDCKTLRSNQEIAQENS